MDINIKTLENQLNSFRKTIDTSKYLILMKYKHLPENLYNYIYNLENNYKNNM